MGWPSIWVYKTVLLNNFILLDGVQFAHGGYIEDTVGGDGGGSKGTIQLEGADHFLLFLGGEYPEITPASADVNFTISGQG